MSIIKACPKCGVGVDVESPSVQKAIDGNELHVKCNNCSAVFILQRWSNNATSKDERLRIR